MRRLFKVKESVLTVIENSVQVPATLTIASRESRLAMWQAEHVQGLLAALYPQCQISILGMTTRGDRILDRTLSQVGGKGLFVKELETAILDGRADLAVHCLKDVPMDLPDGFLMPVVMERHESRDAFVSNHYASLEDLPEGAIVGTSSLRRQALIAARYPHLVIKPLRGNLDTRLGKLDAGQYDAIILAAAGLQRLGLESRIRMPLDVVSSLPAAAQGALSIEILAAPRADGIDLATLLAPLNHADTARAVAAERKVSKVFGASCQIPMAAHATITGALMHLRAMVATPDGLRSAYAELEGPADTPDELGQRVADLLAMQDAHEILAICRQQAAAG